MVTDVSLLEITRYLVDVSDPREYLRAAARAVQQFVAGDDVFWVDTDFPLARFGVWRSSAETRDPVAEQVMPDLLQHPAIQSYVRDPGDLTPRRLVDLGPAPDAAGKAALHLSQEHLGRGQLSMIVDVDPAGRGRGWIVTREQGEFEPSTVESAARLLPVLLALDRVHRPSVCAQREPVIGASRSPRDDGWAELSTRERQVVKLLRGGLTARAIGSTLGISPRTVGKHLEHVYQKVGRHDRLLVALDAEAT
jgi:DNA-binding CsgD family transcriptional regulator